MRISRLEIENYRGIGQMSLDLAPINIFVGRNNTGKSSVLEAVTLAFTLPTRYADAFNTDLLQKFIQRKRSLEYWVKLGKERAKIALTTERLETKEVVLEYIAEGLPKGYEEIRSLLMSKIIEEREAIEERTYPVRRVKPFEPIFRRPKLAIIEPQAKDLTLVYRSAIHKSEYEVVRSAKHLPSNLFFYGVAYRPSLIELHNIAVQTGVFPMLLELLKEQISYLRDLRTVGDDFFIFMEGLEKPVPESFTGDGFRSALLTAFLAALAKHGTLVMEEPETNLHPGLMELVASHLVESAARYETQIFISTHSLEFTEAILNRAPKQTQVVRMHLVKGEIDYESMNGDEALSEAKEIRLDLRGA